jgi:hypothetical protein
MLQQTFATMESEFANDHDACIDAAKGLVECACRVIIDELDDPAKPLKPEKNDPAITDLVAIATRLLKLSDIRHRKFADLIKHHNSLTNSLRELRNEAGTVSHGKDGFIETLSVHHRRTAVLSADTIVTFLHQAYLEAELDLVRTHEPYERFDHLHELIDAHVSLQADVDEEGFLTIDVTLPSGDILPLRVEASRLLYQLDRDAYVEALNAARGAPAAAVEQDELQGEE